MDTWNFRVGIIDPVRESVELVSLEFDGDPATPGWTEDGRIVSLGFHYRQNLWRFRPPAETAADTGAASSRHGGLWAWEPGPSG